MHHHIFAFFLQTVYAIEKLVAKFDWYESVVNLTALSRDAADDVTWYIQHPVPFCAVSLCFLTIFLCLNCGVYDTISAAEFIDFFSN